MPSFEVAQTDAGVDTTDAGLIRRRILPDLKVPICEPCDSATGCYDDKDGPTNNRNIFTTSAIDHQISDLHEQCEKNWVIPFRSIITSGQIIDQMMYQQVVSYLVLMFETSSRLLTTVADNRQSHQVLFDGQDALHRYLVPDFLRLVDALGYEYESVDRVMSMEQVSLLLPNTVPPRRIQIALWLFRCMGKLTFEQARAIFMMESTKAGDLVEMIQAAESGYVENQYQGLLKQFFDAGHGDLLESIGFKKKHIKLLPNKQTYYKFKNCSKRRPKLVAVYTVIRAFCRPANTLV